MGTWGAGLYANDVTCDVRDTYVKFLQEQLSNEDAYRKTIEAYHEYMEDEDEPFVWYALADSQWRLGRLMPEVKEKALGWIEEAGGIVLWEESKNSGAGWKKTLEKLKKQLNTPMPPEKTIKKPVVFIRNPWNIGDVYAYQFNSELSKSIGLFGKYILFQKISDEAWCDGWILSRVQMFDKAFDALPTLYDLVGVRVLPFDKPDRFLLRGCDDCRPLNMNAVMVRYYKNEYPEKCFTFIGNQPDAAKMPLAHPNFSTVFWRNPENEWLCTYYQAWRGYEYEIRDGKPCVRLT